VHPAALGLLAVVLATGPCMDASPPERDAGADAPAAHADGGDACDQLAARYLTTAAQLGSCTDAVDCWAYQADCAIGTHAGAPACYLILNQQADRTQFADMSLAWQHLGCPADSDCGSCTTAPALDCEGGTCVALP
jgi:hypothetical protein